MNTGYDIAVIGMAGRFPGASDLDRFWQNLRDGVESIRTFTEAELVAAGESPSLLGDPDYVRAKPVLGDVDMFDAGFFGFSPQDAAVMDPQHRLFLEVGWEVLEDAGYDPARFAGNIGVFATCGMNTYMMFHLVTNQRIMDTVGEWLVRHTGNDMNFLATRLSYELGLKGPSMNVQTACSSALVAIHLASQSLLNGECDMALAGGSVIALPQDRGYLYKKGEILSPDGHCRAFDARAAGTLFGSGAGVVALRRLADALVDGDRVLAVIKGSAVNNDGSRKVGYLAPSVEGQSRVVTEALAMSGVDPESISYIEAAAIGMLVGDLIEITALTEAYRRYTPRKTFCAIGSLKSNIGHLGEAAGVAGFIKTVLSLEHRQIPPSLHFETPNPQIDFAQSPFFVNTSLRNWQSSGSSRRAGITSIGAGGTNCHVILEEAPDRGTSGESRAAQLLVLSAKTPTALDAATARLAAWLAQEPTLDFADAAYTLKVGRKRFPHRRVLVCRTREEGIVALRSGNGVMSSTEEPKPHPIAFLFPGQGAQYVRMGQDLYETEPVFRDEFDRCAEILRSRVDLVGLLYPARGGADADQLNQTSVTQPALFAVEYSLARLWMHWGIQPHSMIGHSVGEYVAACLAGVFSLEDALTIVAARGALMQRMSPGGMLSVALPAADVMATLAGSSLSLAASNAPALSVVSGPEDGLASFTAEMRRRGIECQRLHTSHAFHSSMMDPLLEEFAKTLQAVSFNAPSIRFISNVTGDWITQTEAVNPAYWVEHLRGTVHFSEGLSTLLQKPEWLLLEVGPGNTLSALAKQQPRKPLAALTSLRNPNEDVPDLPFLLRTLGRLWLAGVEPDWVGFYARERRFRVALPTYPFERQRYWVEARNPAVAEPVKPSGEILATPAAPQIVVSTVDVNHWKERLDIREGEAEAPRQPVVSSSSTVARATAVASGEIETQLGRMWSELLGIDSIGPEDNFFEIGGHSLLAVRLLTRVEKTFKKSIPLQSFFQSGTIAAIAGLIRDDGQAPGKPHVIIPLTESGNAPAFYCCHSVGGDVFSFRELAKALGPDQRFYGIQAPLTKDMATLAGSIESLAAYYVRELIEFQPEGPYILGGWSAGSSIALEMAQQLQQTDRHVDLLVAIDGAPFNTGAGRRPWNPVYVLKLLRNLPLWISDDLLMDFSLKALGRRVRHKAAFIARTRVTGLLGRHHEVSGVEGFLDASNWSPVEWEFVRCLYDALKRYVPKPYAGRVLLYQSRTEPLYHLFEVDRVWRHLSSDVTTIRVSGTHLSLIGEPHVARLAADLRARLADIERSGATTRAD